MSTAGNGNPGQPVQNNTNTNGPMYVTQTGHIKVRNVTGRRGGGKVLLGTLAVDAVFFLYGWLAYTGRNTSGDQWRAGIFIVLLFVTASMLGRWLRRL